MRYLVFFIPTFLVSVFAFSQNKNKERSDAILQAGMQKNVDSLSLGRLKNSPISTTDFIASGYKKTGLRPFTDSGFLQPYTIDLGKEIKPASSLKINGITLEPGIDYWPFSFSPNGFLVGTAVWGAIESNQPFLYDLKPEIENKKTATLGLQQLVKDKTNELAAKKVSAVMFYNSSAIIDSLTFLANDTTKLSTIPVVYFTKSGTNKLRNESTIANAVNAKIVLGEKIVNGKNVLSYLNNGAANTVIITALNSNEIATATILELANLLKETCEPIKKNTTEFNAANYNNNNYLFVGFDGDYVENLGIDYFLNHLPFDAEKINYALNICTVSAKKDTASFLFIGEPKSSIAWNAILQNTSQPAITKLDSALPFNFNSMPYDKKGIPNLYLFNSIVENQQENKTITINKNDIKTVRYMMQLISSANNYGKLPSRKKMGIGPSIKQ